MQSEVSLQGPFSYSLGYIVILLILLLLCVVLYFVFRHFEKTKKKKEVKVVVEKPVDVNVLKNKYLQIINGLEKEYDDGKVTYRDAYIKISEIIRNFIFEVTKIKVQNCTLQEIERLKMPVLTELMNEYYKPEFAYNEKGNVKESINKTREAIGRWS